MRQRGRAGAPPQNTSSNVGTPTCVDGVRSAGHRWSPGSVRASSCLSTYLNLAAWGIVARGKKYRTFSLDLPVAAGEVGACAPSAVSGPVYAGQGRRGRPPAAVARPAETAAATIFSTAPAGWCCPEPGHVPNMAGTYSSLPCLTTLTPRRTSGDRRGLSADRCCAQSPPAPFRTSLSDGTGLLCLLCELTPRPM